MKVCVILLEAWIFVTHNTHGPGRLPVQNQSSSTLKSILSVTSSQRKDGKIPNLDFCHDTSGFKLGSNFDSFHFVAK